MGKLAKASESKLSAISKIGPAVAKKIKEKHVKKKKSDITT
jgi:hypothetical protein